uniref:Uncharacterized protein n=1 Tax=Caenorhabditis tropicalis TaxID=1561998 RepID=A0A1I7UTX2_9PELO
MNSSMEHSSDDVVAGSLISTVSLSGCPIYSIYSDRVYRVLTNGYCTNRVLPYPCDATVSLRCRSFGILTANQNFSQLIACVATLIFYSFGLTL